MPYNPGIEYRGDRYLFAGITGAGEAIGEGIRRYRQDRMEGKMLDTEHEQLSRLLAKRMKTAGQPGDEEVIDRLAKYPSMGLGAKRAAVNSLKVELKMADDLAREAAVERRHSQAMGYQQAGLEVDRGRLLKDLMERERVAADRDRATQEQQGLNAELAQYFGSPETVRAPIDQVVPGMLSRHNAATPNIAMQLLDQAKAPFRPELIDLGGGVQAMTSSKGSAVPVIKPAAAQKPASAIQLLTLRSNLIKSKASVFSKDSSAGEIDSQIQALDDLLAAAGVEIPGAPSGTAGGGKLDAKKAAEFLRQAGGDKAKARQLAKDAGYDF
jgi:hypothetical protein